jgi:hypothetical protein
MIIILYRCDVCRDTVALTSEESANLETLREKPGNENQLTFIAAPHALCDGAYRIFAKFEADDLR